MYGQNTFLLGHGRLVWLLKGYHDGNRLLSAVASGREGAAVVVDDVSFSEYMQPLVVSTTLMLCKLQKSHEIHFLSNLIS